MKNKENKKNIICLRCGNVQIRTDIEEVITGSYITLDKKKMCPKCRENTNFIATNNIQELRKQLEQNPSKPIDSYLLKLVKK